MMTAEERSVMIEIVFSHLALTLEEAMLRVEAYRKVIAQSAPQLAIRVGETENDLQDSPLRQQYIALRTQAVQAVRDLDAAAFVESVGHMRGVARQQLGFVSAGFQTEVKS
jgi:hypothetical protein